MTTRIGPVVIIAPTTDEKCSRCGQDAECRDVRGDGRKVCFPCATPEDREIYIRRLFGPQETN